MVPSCRMTGSAVAIVRSTVPLDRAPANRISMADFDALTEAVFDEHRQDRDLDRRAENQKPYKAQLDVPDENGRIARDVIRAFKPTDAGLPELSAEQAEAHFAAHVDKHPWLKPAEKAAPETRHIFTALDRGEGHALQRLG